MHELGNFTIASVYGHQPIQFTVTGDAAACQPMVISAPI
jgi:hypothetical protein